MSRVPQHQQSHQIIRPSTYSAQPRRRPRRRPPGRVCSCPPSQPSARIRPAEPFTAAPSIRPWSTFRHRATRESRHQRANDDGIVQLVDVVLVVEHLPESLLRCRLVGRDDGAAERAAVTPDQSDNGDGYGERHQRSSRSSHAAARARPDAAVPPSWYRLEPVVQQLGWVRARLANSGRLSQPPARLSSPRTPAARS